MKSIVDHVVDSIITIDENCLIQTWNPAAEKLFGWSSSEVIGRNAGLLRPAFHGSHCDGHASRCPLGSQSMIGGTGGEVLGQRKDGTTFMMELTVREFRHDGRRFFTGIVRDTSSRIRYQHGLEEGEERFRSVADAAPVMIWSADTTKKCDYFNHPWLKFTGKTLEQEAGDGWLLGVHPDDRGQVMERFSLAFDRRQEFKIEYRLRRHDGEFRWILDHGAPRLLSDGTFAGYVGSCVDVTDLRMASENQKIQQRELEQIVAMRTKEAQLRESQLRLITDALPYAVAYFDRDQRFLFMNSTYRKWRQKSEEELIGRSIRDVMGEEDYQKFEPYLLRTLAGEPTIREARIRYADKVRTVCIHNFPDVGPDGEVRGFIVVADDISDQKSREVEMIRAKDAADAAKSAFLANMSHEIRTPLGAVLGFSELLLDENLSQSEKLQYVGTIRRNGELLSNIISDILDLSKVEAGKLNVELHDVRLSEILSDITTLLNLQAVEKGIRLSITSEGVVPSTIRTDALRLRQILLNIIGNAIKFTQRGSVDVVLKMAQTQSAHPLLTFEVSDSGPGITAENAEKLFQTFTQVDPSMTRKHGGSGLGLALSKRLANLLGGDVSLVRTEVGKGSVFAVSIDPGPVERMHLKNFEPTGRARPDPTGEDSICLDGMRVLLVEDSPDNQVLVGQLLKLGGAMVELASNGKEAIDKVHDSGPYDVILMDLQMPVMDGYEATATLRKEAYAGPIIALSAHTLKEERQQCLSSGFTDHLCKPVDRHLLLASLGRYRGRTRAAGSARSS
jgi:PAS domain S-box-containing protein